MAQTQTLTTHLAQHLTQQQLRFVELLSMNTQELEEAVEQELLDNPALESADSAAISTSSDSPFSTDGGSGIYHYRQGRTGEGLPEFLPRDNGETLSDVLHTQISQLPLPERISRLADYIIGNLDSNGYLCRPLEGMLDDLSVATGQEFSPEEGREALEQVRRLDPPGVGAENLRECLLLQLHRLPRTQTVDDAILILQEQFEAFGMRHSHKIISALHMTRERVERARELILTLNPKPGATYGGEDTTTAAVIIPDYRITEEDGEFHITLDSRLPELYIEESFTSAMKGVELRRGRPRKGTEYVRDRYKNALDFINILRQRRQTMLSIMTAILSYQRAYFETGDVYALRPMIIKNIEALTGYDKSVISRATNNKYVATPWGEILPVRAFFSDTVATTSKKGDPAPEKNPEEPGETSGLIAANVDRAAISGERDETPESDGSKPDQLTNRQIEEAIRSLVEEEDKKHPLSDEKIRAELQRIGYDISRRTVAKYRDRIGILVARLRKEF